MKKAILAVITVVFVSGCKIPFSDNGEKLKIGKYQMAIHGSKTYILDTADGRFWEKEYGDKGWFFVSLDTRPLSRKTERDKKIAGQFKTDEMTEPQFPLEKNSEGITEKVAEKASEEIREKVSEKSREEEEFERRVEEISKLIREYEMRKAKSALKSRENENAEETDVKSPGKSDEKEKTDSNNLTEKSSKKESKEKERESDEAEKSDGLLDKELKVKTKKSPDKD